MKILSTLIVLVFMLLKANAKQDDVSFLIKTIKDSYAGYQDIKANEFEQYVTKLLDQEKDTFKILSKIVTFFDNPHLQLFKPASMNGIIVDSAMCQRNIEIFERYITNKALAKDIREGYWVNDKNTVVIALKRIKEVPLTYHAYLIETRATALVPKGFIIAQMEANRNGKFETDFITPRGGMRVFIPSLFKNDSTFTTGDLGKWTKLKKPYASPLLPNLPALNYVTSGKLLDTNTYVLTIPDFLGPQIRVVDSIIKRDYNQIASAKNLIIDIRDNAGGTVRVYSPLYPFIYTGPIPSIRSATLCSEGYSNYLKESLSITKSAPSVDSFILNYLKEEIKRIDSNMGKFVLRPADTFRLDKVMTRPKNIGIIINYAVESAAEMMVLDFRHSKKVKVFGEHTMGAVDYLNTYNAVLPSGKYVLVIASAKRHISRGQRSFDKTGIPPDIPISDNVQDWVQFVKKYYDRTN